MSDLSTDPAKLKALVSNLLDGSASAEQHVELEQLMLDSDSLKRTYVQLLSTHALLRWMYGTVPRHMRVRSPQAIGSILENTVWQSSIV